MQENGFIEIAWVYDSAYGTIPTLPNMEFESWKWIYVSGMSNKLHVLPESVFILFEDGLNIKG